MQVVFTILACWIASGIVFGFAALKPVLIAEGVYRKGCTDNEAEDEVYVCKQQDLRYVIRFNCFLFSSNISPDSTFSSPSLPSLQMSPFSPLELSSIAMARVNAA